MSKLLFLPLLVALAALIARDALIKEEVMVPMIDTDVATEMASEADLDAPCECPALFLVPDDTVDYKAIDETTADLGFIAPFY